MPSAAWCVDHKCTDCSQRWCAHDISRLIGCKLLRYSTSTCLVDSKNLTHTHPHPLSGVHTTFTKQSHIGVNISIYAWLKYRKFHYRTVMWKTAQSTKKSTGHTEQMASTAWSPVAPANTIGCRVCLNYDGALHCKLPCIGKSLV